MSDPFLNYMEWRDENANDASGQICDECQHPVSLHVTGGCTGASELCGCTAWEVEEIDEAEDVAPAVGYPELERESDSRLQQAIASAYAVYVQRTIVTR